MCTAGVKKKRKRGGVLWVSSHGRIQNGDGLRYFATPNDNGYPGFRTKFNGRNKALYVHRIVHVMLNDPGLKGFFTGATVDHIDRNPLNSKMTNLRWASRKLQHENRVSLWVLYESTFVASKKTGCSMNNIAHAANPKSRLKTVPGRDGRYEFRKYDDGSQADLEGEVWKLVDPLDWLEGGKYAHV